MNTKDISLERKLLRIFAGVMLMSNFCLTLTAFFYGTIVVLVPTLDKEIRVGTHSVSDEYLKLRTEEILYQLFPVADENINGIKRQLQRQVDINHYKDVETQIDNLWKQRKFGYRYLFRDIQSIEIGNMERTVKVTGYLEAYLGDKLIEKKLKQYKFSYVNKAALLNLVSIEEVENIPHAVKSPVSNSYGVMLLNS
jgi:hypothetical protein